ncbi:MAG: hypothetical protein Q9219_005372 [cf. Caloplaca sp. 3 TL-2023]
MSAAKDEAGTGPELSASDADTDEDNAQEEGLSEDERRNKIPHNIEAYRQSSDSAALDSRDLDEAPPSLANSPPNEVSPAEQERPSSADGSFSIPDDTPSVQGSLASSTSRQARTSAFGRSPTPSLLPFDRRFQARFSPSPQNSSRAASPAFIRPHSRTASVTSQLFPKSEGIEPDQAPWEVVRWTKLRRISGQAFSEVGKRSFGRPVCIAISTSIVLGTSKGIILVFDYNQNLKSIIGPGTKATESGPVTSIAISADHSTVAGGHASGHIYTWEFAKPAKPFLHIPPVDRKLSPETDGHVVDVAVLHLGFLGSRHTALVSADDKGMAFSHLATRGMGIVARTVKTTRILGRYPANASPRKPSSVLAFSPLPLGNAEQASDTMGLVAMLTPYLLVIVSTTPIAQTQYKTPRPKEVVAHSAMTAALAWFPSVKLKVPDQVTAETSSKVKLVYCWSNVLTVLEVVEVEPSRAEGPPNLQFRSRSKWKAQEAIAAVQWLGRSVLAILTITQQLIILEDSSLRQTNSSDLIQKHIYHVDLFSQQLNMLVEQLDEEDTSMHGVVADAFYMSFRAYKGRLFLLGFNELSFGQLSNWADRLLALMEEGSYIGAIELAISYYTGEADKVSVGLPDDDNSRHRVVLDKLIDMMSATLKYTFDHDEADNEQLRKFAGVCISACVNVEDMDFLFEEVYPRFLDSNVQNIFLEILETFILDDQVQVLPPTVIKDLVSEYMNRNSSSRLEEMLCHLEPGTMDLDQINGLCKRNHLYEALFYVWNQALDDYTSILDDLLSLVQGGHAARTAIDAQDYSAAFKIFPYLSYILTGRVYPTGKRMDEDKATAAKADIYHFFFPRSGSLPNGNLVSRKHSETSFSNLRKVLDFDAANFLSMLNEAFEDNFLNGAHDYLSHDFTDTQKSGLSVNRQLIVDILLEVMEPPKYGPDDTVYLNMFVARNFSKFPQIILLTGHTLHRILVGLCEYPEEEVAEDCQLSVEYLLSRYQPPDVHSLLPLLNRAGFFRVLRSIYRSEREYAKLLQTCFDEGPSNGNLIFECLAECFDLGVKQIDDVLEVIKANAKGFVERDVSDAATTLERYAPTMHEFMIEALTDGEQRLEYLKTILDSGEQDKPMKVLRKDLLELYVRLLCEHDPHHINEYVERMKSGDLRLEKVLPALESSGVVDAAVVLMAREGQLQEAMDRLTSHLDTLEAALHGLIDAAAESPDVENTAEAAQDLIASLQKFTRIGIWLCKGYHGKSMANQLQRAKRKQEELSLGENLWLDLIDAVVKVTKRVAETVQPSERDVETRRDPQPESTLFDSSKMTTDLRTVVQETFTALLSATSISRGEASFLRILRGFLQRASASSPSLANLRSVLATIFSAYSYEKDLLELANRLLDKDLFVHVQEADALRRRGWRPLGQVCEGCRKRVWGPGAGRSIWEAWRRRDEEDAERKLQQHGLQFSGDDTTGYQDHGKGKAVEKEVRHVSASEEQVSQGKDMMLARAGNEDEDMTDAVVGGVDALIVFSCDTEGSERRNASYSLKDDYVTDKFFDMFTFDTIDDPTHGYVNFVDQATARSSGMIDSNDGAVELRVDSTNVASGRGRNSLRLTSKASYNRALIVLDLAHMPGNACGMWPAFWTTGPNWPSSGEIDIIEGVNMESKNQMTMHTSEGCSLAGSTCLANEGCSLNGGAFGDQLNSGNGGTYAMEWTSNSINVWFFNRGQEPGDVLGESPDPKGWGSPTASFEGGSSCDIDQHFKDQQIVFDTTFCGDWAGKAWSEEGACSAKVVTCEEYVQNNPEAFTEAFWKINALKVYISDGSTKSTQPLQEPNSTFAQQPQQSIPKTRPVITQFVDGGPVTITSNGPPKMPTQTMVGAPVTMTVAPGFIIPQEHAQHSSGNSTSGQQRRKRGRWRQHLAEHLRSAST